MQNAFTADIEDYFHTEAMSGVAPRQSWNKMALRVENNTRRLFSLLERHEIRATMFFLGWVAERCPGLVAEAVARGHEIGCHSYWHFPVYRLSPREFREDTKRAKDVIESAAGQTIYGYRAPSFSIIHGMTWATDILSELGFTYDSSCNPINHDLYNNPNAPRQPHHTPSGLLEIPVSTWRVGKINLPVGGGAYLRVLPSMYMRVGLRRLVAAGERLVLYVHPWEIDPGQPRLAAPVKSRLRQYLGLTRMEIRLERLVATYAFSTIENAFTLQHSSQIEAARKNWNLHAECRNF
jgi:polysaccharide deacetylase family protein (PEP-CTERM system associated)